MHIDTILKQNIQHWLQEAGDMAVKLLYNNVELKVALKSDESPVSLIDTAVEEILRTKIMQAFPNDGIVGEELEDHQCNAARLWIIDPIDGTRAMLAGFTTFTIMLALVENGRPLLGAIYQPLGKNLWIGHIIDREFKDSENLTKDNLQFITFYNGCHIVRDRAVNKLAEAMFSTTSPYLFAKEDRIVIENIAHQARYYQFGGDGYAYAQLAMGNIDVIVESGLKPHDFMPLIPIIEGTGGVITDWHGHKLNLRSAGFVCASGNLQLHEEVLAKLR